MARNVEPRYGYFQLKADLSSEDAAILEQLIAHPAAAPEVVGDLVLHRGMTPADAYCRVRSLLLTSMQRLGRGV